MYFQVIRLCRAAFTAVGHRSLALVEVKLAVTLEFSGNSRGGKGFFQGGICHPGSSAHALSGPSPKLENLWPRMGHGEMVSNIRKEVTSVLRKSQKIPLKAKLTSKRMANIDRDRQ